jgi:hypothetical protein
MLLGSLYVKGDIIVRKKTLETRCLEQSVAEKLHLKAE